MVRRRRSAAPNTRGWNVTNHNEVKVSVVVPIHNIGRDLYGLIASLDRQTLPADEFEVVLVDDGSTDDTLAVAQEFAAQRPRYVVETIPNSGWPGKPRNVGTLRAQGKYVFYADDDDDFCDGALAALYECAERHSSDIVYGKIVRVGRPTPYWELWRHDVAAAEPSGAPVVSRTVHKLFRRQFILDNELRFREGRVRLEDHQFMAQAVPRARTISILASTPVYRWIFRNDSGSISKSPSSHAVYWADYGDVLTTWEKAAGPGPVLDSARVAAMVQAFTRFTPSGYLARDVGARDSLTNALSDLVDNHFPASLDARLPVWKRLAVIALRRRDRDLFDAVQSARTGVAVHLHTDDIANDSTTLRVALRAEVRTKTRFGAIPTIVLHRRSGARLPVPRRLRSRFPADALLIDEPAFGEIELTLRHRHTGVEWPVPNQHRIARGRARLRVAQRAEIDLTTDPFGAPLDPGIWDVMARVRFLGEASVRRVAVPKSAQRANLTGSAVYTTKSGNLAFTVGTSRPTVVEAHWQDHELVLRLSDNAAGDLVHGERDGSHSGSVPIVDGAARVHRDALGVGAVDFWVRSASADRIRLGYTGPDINDREGSATARVYATKHRSLSVLVRREA